MGKIFFSYVFNNRVNNEMYLFAAKIQDMFYSVCGKFGVLSVLIDGDNFK